MKKEKDSDKLFRFTVVSLVKLKLQQGSTLPKAITAVSEEGHYTPEGNVKHVNARTLYRWYQAYEKNGASGLSNKSKSGHKKLKLSEQELKFIRKTKEDDPLASVPEVIKQGLLQDKLSMDTSRTTVYRACKRMNLPLLRSSTPKIKDMRRFSYPNRMAMVLCDGKHFRVGATKQKRVALIYIDDATRYVLHQIVGTAESSVLFLRGLYEVINKYGFMGSIYFDHGPGFNSFDVKRVLSKLNIPFILGSKGYAEGRGKVEKFNRTLKQDFTRGLCKESIDTAIPAIELRLKHYIEEIYNKSPHSSLKKRTPYEAFNDSNYPLTFPENIESLKQMFVLEEKRKVSKDNIISVKGESIELPTGYAGRTVTIFRYIMSNEIYIFHNGSKIHLHKLDPTFNALNKRRHQQTKSYPTDVKLASEISYEQQMAPMVDNNGNFYEEKKC